MNRLNKFFYYFIVLISFLVIIVSLLSLSYNNTRWWMKAMDFPRVQYLVVAFACLVIFGLRNPKMDLLAGFPDGRTAGDGGDPRKIYFSLHSPDPAEGSLTVVR